MKHSLLETTIGALVLGMALIFLMFSYSTAHRGEGGMMDGSYRITAVFDNVGGLGPGDNVMISGVKVGAVDRIDLDDKLYRARVTFSVTSKIKLARDTSARIASESLLGGKYLDLQPGGDDADLSSGDTITMTQSSTNLEDLLGRFIFSSGAKEEKPSDKDDRTDAPTMPSDPAAAQDHP